jgi:hypothetical protein
LPTKGRYDFAPFSFCIYPFHQKIGSFAKKLKTPDQSVIPILAPSCPVIPACPESFRDRLYPSFRLLSLLVSDQSGIIFICHSSSCLESFLKKDCGQAAMTNPTSLSALPTGKAGKPQ